MQRCTHLDQINYVTPSAGGWEECPRMGDSRVHPGGRLDGGRAGYCTADMEPNR